MSRHEDAALPGAYLRDHIAPYVNTISAATPLEMRMKRYEDGMKGHGWQTITQIADAIGSTDNAVRAYLKGRLKDEKLVERKDGIPTKAGPCPALWRWVG